MNDIDAASLYRFGFVRAGFRAVSFSVVDFANFVFSAGYVRDFRIAVFRRELADLTSVFIGGVRGRDAGFDESFWRATVFRGWVIRRVGAMIRVIGRTRVIIAARERQAGKQQDEK